MEKVSDPNTYERTVKIKSKAKGLIICVLAVIFSFSSGIAEGADWERVSEYEDTFIYMDKASMRRISDTVTGALFKIVYQEPFWVGLKSIDYYLIAQENDCGANKYRVSTLTVYFRDGTTETITPKEEYSVNPDTFQAVIHEFVCKPHLN